MKEPNIQNRHQITSGVQYTVEVERERKELYFILIQELYFIQGCHH